MDLLLAGKRLLLVGGTSGMGLATARVVADEGASLVLVGRDPERAAAAIESLPRGAAPVTAICADVRRPGDVERAISQAVEFLGGLDGVGVFTGVTGHEPLDVPDEAWSEVFDDVLLGTVRVVRAALPHLMTGGGTVVTTSAYSIRAPDGARLPYTSLKAAVAVFTKGVATAYGRYGIRANCICPGAIETEPMRELRGHLAEARGLPYEEAIERVMVDEWGLDVALGRPGKPEEVGELAAFLLSPRAGYLTGALVNIDGGTDF
ncbi:MAG: SDR family NAD(P)-dependent oxidoreductase [Acidimicrobiales bacterium]